MSDRSRSEMPRRVSAARSTLISKTTSMRSSSVSRSNSEGCSRSRRLRSAMGLSACLQRELANLEQTAFVGARDQETLAEAGVCVRADLTPLRLARDADRIVVAAFGSRITRGDQPHRLATVAPRELR